MNLVFKPVYSWLLVPLTFILYIIYPDIQKYLIPLMCSIALIGIIGATFYDKDMPLWQTIASNIVHAILLIGLLQIGNLDLNNYINYILLIFGVLFILFTPHWPYTMNKTMTNYIYIFTFISLFVINYLLIN